MLKCFHDLAGIFQPPVDGQYYLTLNIVTEHEHSATADLMQDNQVLCKTHSTDYGGWTGSSCSVLVYLETFDSVFVTRDPSRAGDDGPLKASYTGFTGFFVSSSQ